MRQRCTMGKTEKAAEVTVITKLKICGNSKSCHWSGISGVMPYKFFIISFFKPIFIQTRVVTILYENKNKILPPLNFLGPKWSCL